LLSDGKIIIGIAVGYYISRNLSLWSDQVDFMRNILTFDWSAQIERELLLLEECFQKPSQPPNAEIKIDVISPTNKNQPLNIDQAQAQNFIWIIRYFCLYLVIFEKSILHLKANLFKDKLILILHILLLKSKWKLFIHLFTLINSFQADKLWWSWFSRNFFSFRMRKVVRSFKFFIPKGTRKGFNFIIIVYLIVNVIRLFFIYRITNMFQYSFVPMSFWLLQNNSKL